MVSPQEGVKPKPEQSTELKQDTPKKKSEREFKYDDPVELNLGLGVRTEYLEWMKHRHDELQLPRLSEVGLPPLVPFRLSDLEAKIEPPGQDGDEVSHQVRTRSRGKASTCEDQMPVKGKGKAKDKSKDKDLEFGRHDDR